MLRNAWISQIVYSFLAAVILAGGDFLFFWFHFENKYPRHWSAFYETFGLVLLLTFAFQKRGVFISLCVLMFLAFVQMAHLSFFGTFIHPTKIYLAFINIGELSETTSQIGRLIMIPFWIMLFSAFCIWLSGYLAKVPFKNWRPMKWVLLVALLYIPIRTVVRQDDYGKQPAIHNMAFSNMYSSFSYFFARTLPFKLQRKDIEPVTIKLDKATDQPQINVIFVLGESLRYQNMQLFGYTRPTTPELMKVSQEFPTVYRKAISGGVCTDVAIPMFINNYQNTSPMSTILSQEQCLFKLAKNNGFETHFYSAQAEGDLKHIVNYICTAAIDHMKIGPGISLIEDSEKRYYDDILLKDLEKVDFAKPQFLVLHQRGSHSPYNLRYPADQAAFQLDPNSDVTQQMITEYDNSVAFTDKIISGIVREVMRKSNLPTYVVFTSDHGQVLGENKSWGHNDLNEFVFKIPFMFFSKAKDPVFEKVNQFSSFTTHKQISDLIVDLLGYRNPTALKIEQTGNKVFVMGYDLDGLEGGMWVEIGPDGIKSVTHDDLSPLNRK